MTISSIGGKPATAIQSLVNLRNSLDDLQRQLSTGKKSTTYAGLGLDRGVTVSLRSQLSAMTSFDATANNVMTRINVAQTSLGRISDLGATVKQSLMQGSYGSGVVAANTAQTAAKLSLDETLSLLNTRAGDRYLFSGRATDQPAVETYDHIINGDGARAGLKQIISERNQADLGASGLGRLDVTTPTATSISVDEQATSFGFKLAAVSSTLTNAVVTGPTGAPANITVDLTGGNPNDGDNITLRYTLPDGTSETMTMTATSGTPLNSNQFQIGATTTATTNNLQATLTAALGKLANTALTAASATQASSEFFSADASTPPPRVAGPPFDTATAMTTGSSADTVIWYTGETGSDPARSTANARVDPSLSVSYGVRANEDGIRKIVQNVATLAAVDISSSNPDATDLSLALNQRLTDNLSGSPGTQTVADIQSDLASAQVTINAAQTRHQQQNATLTDYLQQIEGVSNEEVGAEILTLQTRLQASMQVTSLLYQTSLVNYLK
jgi:flagellin-like hook-associated protein FlgL